VEARLEPRTPAVPVLDPPNVLWYFGALAGTIACVAIVGQVPASARGTWVLLVSLAFIGVYAALSFGLLRAGWQIPGGVVAATAVSFVPIAGAAFEQLVGIGATKVVPDSGTVLGDTESPPGAPVEAFHGRSFALVLLTIVAGLLVYRRLRFAFVLAWVAVAAFIGTQIVLPLFDSDPGTAAHFDAALGAGIFLVVVGLVLDQRGIRREAFWWHLVGLVAVTAAFSYHTSFHSSPGWVSALLAGLVALGLAVLYRRATFAFFGLLGLYAPLAHYGDDWFGNLGLACALAALGFTILAAGIVVQGTNRRLPAAV
jgi:hypothetical protein